MHSLLRISLLALFAALGIAVAIAVALQEPPPKAATIAKAKVLDAAAAPQALQPPVPLVIAPYRDPVAGEVSGMTQAVEGFREVVGDLVGKLNQIEENAAQSVQPVAEAIPPAKPTPAQREPLATAAADSVRRNVTGDKLSIDVQNSDIRAVLDQLAKEGGFNVIASKSVTGTVTVSLTDVDIETALGAVLKSTGFVARHENGIVYVGTPQDLVQMDQIQDAVISRVYRPNYVKAADFQALITPMLTPEIGKITVSTASEVDIPADQTKTGGNSFSGTDVVIVRDYEARLREIDQIFAEVDVKPKQVAIEAMILSVKLSDQQKCGVDFEALKNQANVRLISNTPLGGLDAMTPSGGLKFGFLDGSLSLFIDCLETVGDTNVIASPRLTVLNKQRAEIQIGEELGYVSTTVTENSATQSVNFLETGTLLRIRPFVGNDGMIRLEVHPELSTGSVSVEQGLTLPNKAVTQVTTNVLCPDACTVIIGGLIREDLQSDRTQIPYLGNLPWLGPLFRHRDDQVDRIETIVLITPRVVSEPMMCEEGCKYGNSFTQRQNVYFDKMSPIGKRNLGNHYLRLARAAHNAGDYQAALKQVNMAIHFDPLSRDAIALRNDVLAAGGYEDESINQYLHQGIGGIGRHKPDYSKQGYPWKEFEGFHGPHEGEPMAIDDPGQPGPTRNIIDGRLAPAYEAPAPLP